MKENINTAAPEQPDSDIIVDKRGIYIIKASIDKNNRIIATVQGYSTDKIIGRYTTTTRGALGGHMQVYQHTHNCLITLHESLPQRVKEQGKNYFLSLLRNPDTEDGMYTWSPPEQESRLEKLRRKLKKPR